MKQDRGIESILHAFAGEQVNQLLDAVASELHNEGQTIDGNTGESDVLWFAEWIYTVNANRVGAGDRCAWRFLDEEDRNSYIQIAQLCIECLPYLSQRIANRYTSLAAAFRTMERAVRDRNMRYRVDVSMIKSPKGTSEKITVSRQAMARLMAEHGLTEDDFIVTTEDGSHEQ